MHNCKWYGFLYIGTALGKRKSMTKPPILQVIKFADGEFTVLQGVTRDFCVQSGSDEGTLSLIKNQIAFYNAQESDTGRFDDLPAAPDIYRQVFAECQESGTISVTELCGYEVQLAIANTEQAIRTLAAIAIE